MPYQIVHSCRARSPMGLADLQAILLDARTGDGARRVNEALVCVDGVFLHILEGHEAPARTLMRSTATDSRHSAVTVFRQRAVAGRCFGNWRMAHLNASPEQSSTWAGLPGTRTVDAMAHDLGDGPGGIERVAGGISATIVA
jgi:hypothetical protein